MQWKTAMVMAMHWKHTWWVLLTTTRYTFPLSVYFLLIILCETWRKINCWVHICLNLSFYSNRLIIPNATKSQDVSKRAMYAARNISQMRRLLLHTGKPLKEQLSTEMLRIMLWYYVWPHIFDYQWILSSPCSTLATLKYWHALFYLEFSVDHHHRHHLYY